MARDRKRAKQRQQRRGPRPAGAGGNGRDAAQGNSQVTRADLPGALEHVGDVDEFDAALIRGAGGVPLSDVGGDGMGEGPIPPGIEPLSDESAAAPAVTPGDGEPASAGNGNELAAAGNSGNGVTAAPVRAPARPTHERQSLPKRAIAFLRASWAELQRVQWPNRAQTTQATAVVLGFVAVAGIYFGIADYVAKEIVEAIL
jgi:preprotein translocase subunit SecE